MDLLFENSDQELPTQVVNKYRTQPTSQLSYDFLDDVEENGIKVPLGLVYHVHDHKLALSDGHHRLDAALELGIEKVPVKIRVVGNDAPKTAKTPPKVPVWKGKDYLKVSDLF